VKLFFFNRDIYPQEVIDFIERNFDLSKKTGGYNLEERSNYVHDPNGPIGDNWHDEIDKHNLDYERLSRKQFEDGWRTK
jgi:hypothetical protein